MPDTEQIKQYLSLLFGRVENGYIEARPIHGNKVEQEFFSVSGPSDSAADYLRSVAGRRNVFAGVCPRSQQDDGSESSIAYLNTVWADVDVKDFSGDKPSVLSHIRANSPLKPTAIVDSGHGFHVYWILDDPIKITGQKDSAKELIKRYHTAVSADATHDLSRVLRVPGTPNIKDPDNPVPCEFESISGELYSLQQLSETVKDQTSLTVDQLRKKLPNRAIQRAKNAPERFQGDRSGNDFYVAQKLSQSGFSQQEIKEAFDLFAERGWDAGSKYSERGQDYLEHLLDGTLINQKEQLDSTLEVIRESDNGLPTEALEEACQIIANLPPVQQDLKQNELQDALGGRSAVSIKSIRKQVDAYSDGIQTPETAAECGQALLEQTDYLNLEGSLYYYEDGVYKPDGESKIRAQIQRLLADDWTRNKRRDAIEWVKDKRYTELEQLPDNRGLINCKNGVYDIFEDKLLEHKPDYQFIWQVDAEYQPNVEHDRLDKFMQEVFYEEDIQVAWEHCGYCLLPWFNLKKFLILVGGGDNGKSVFLSMIENVLGEESVSHETLRILSSNQFSTKELFGKLANICADITADRIKHVEILKALTGGDMIRAEIKNGPTFDFQNKAKLLFSANEVPNMSEISKAFFRRLHLIRCPNEFPPGQRDPNLLEKLSTEQAKSAWLNKAIEGAKRLIQNEQFSSSEKMSQELTSYRKRVDSVTEFLQGNIEQNDSKYEAQKAVYDAYRGWCKRAGRQPVSSSVFRKRAKIDPNNLYEDTRVLDSGEVKVYTGIRLKGSVD